MENPSPLQFEYLAITTPNGPNAKVSGSDGPAPAPDREGILPLQNAFTKVVLRFNALLGLPFSFQRFAKRFQIRVNLRTR